MNDLSKYEAVRDQMKPGDVIAFWGDACISRLIEVFSAGPSHVGMVRLIVSEDGVKQVQMTESTIDGGKSGAQTCRLSQRLLEYHGSAAWLPLAPEIRALINWQKFYAFIEAAENPATQVKYDTPGLFGFLARSIPIIGPRVCQSENMKQMFCSGYDTGILEASGVLRGINVSKTSPQDFGEMGIYGGFYPILGNPPKIRNFNTV